MDDDQQLDPQAVWLRAQEAMEQADEMHEMLAARRAERAGSVQWTPPTPEPPKPVHRAIEPRQRAQQPSGGVDWAATRTWVEQIVSARLESFAGVVGKATAEMAKKERVLLRGEFNAALDTLRAELRAEFTAAIAAAQIAELTRRLVAAELRAAPPAKPEPPRLIAAGHSDAAD